MSSDSKRGMIEFLDKKAFDPVLHARPDSYPETKRAKLDDVQRATRSEKERYHHYSSAEQVYRMFRDDLSSEPAQKIHHELRELGLPTLKDIRGEFDKLASDLGVRT
jgi:hypothetical protein